MMRPLLSRRPLSLSVHAHIDFVSVVVMLLAPRLLRLQPASVAVSAGLAGAGLLIGSATDYPYPVHRSRDLTPARHRQLERLSFPVLLVLLIGTGRLARRADRTYFLMVLLAYGLTHGLTDWPHAAPNHHPGLKGAG
ncbi:hypothetical protein [Deinococcus ficus]|uniref:Uncharacterized protein n=1 Tax=Deinococcus ficus TaxID=317577 RepID=A0A221T1R4_9DEIO|nr:hypothetical protein [Deinococcus ficus]ASN82847.1 hypothetical protein DFI_16775 [Deinococcus ficus]